MKKKSSFLVIRGILLGIFFIFFCILDGHLERISIVIITLILISIVKIDLLKPRNISIILITLICSFIFHSLALYYYINNQENTFLKRYDTLREEYEQPAVIIVAEGEIPTYHTKNILNNIYKEDSIMQKVLAPYTAFNYKLAYDNLGRSKYIDICNNIGDELQKKLGTDYHVYTTFLSNEPNFEKEIIEIKKKYSKIIIVPLMLSLSSEYQENMNTAFNDYEGIILQTPVLWNSEKLSRQLAKKTLNIDEDLDVNLTGVLIMQTNTINNKNHAVFEKKVINKLIDYGVERDKIVSVKGTINYDTLKNSIRSLQETGVNRIIIVSIDNVTDGILTKYKVEKIAEKIAKKELIKIDYIAGWGIGEDMLNELEYKIRIANLKN